MASLDLQGQTRLYTRDFILVCLASIGTFAGMSFLAPTLPIYVINIGGGKEDIGLIIGIFSAAAVLTRPFVGRAVDQRGSKGILVAGSFLLVLSATLYILASSVPVLLALRVLHGAALAAATTAAFAFVAAVSPSHRRGEAMGIYGLFMNLSFIVWPVVGSFLAATYGFTALFSGMAVVSALALGLVLPLSAANTNEASVVGRRSSLISRSALVPSMVFFCMASTFAPIMAFLPLFAIERSLGNVGVFFGLQAAVAFLAQTPAGRLSDTYGRAPVIVVGLLLLFLALSLLAFSFSSLMFLGVAIVLGLGAGSVQPALLALVVDGAREGEQGAAMATTTAAMDLGLASGSILWGLLAGRIGYSSVYIGAGAIALMGLVFFLAWQKRQKKVAS